MNNSVDVREIGSRIQKYRLVKNMTQDELAEKIDFGQKNISRIEAGNHNLSFDTVVAITRALEILVDSLIADHDDNMDESTLHEILNTIRGMSPKQLDLLRDNITTLRKLDK